MDKLPLETYLLFFQGNPEPKAPVELGDVGGVGAAEHRRQQRVAGWSLVAGGVLLLAGHDAKLPTTKSPPPPK